MNDLEHEIAFLKQAILAKTVCEDLENSNSRKHNGPMSHSHYCKHCDVMLRCGEAECILPEDLSRLHRCGERQNYLHRMRRLLGQRDCKFKCKGECSHPHKEVFLPQEEQWEYMRPKIAKHVHEVPIMRFASGYAGHHVEDCVCNECKRSFRLAK